MTKIIATHSYTDMDALLGVYLVGKFICDGDYEVRFYPANTVLDEELVEKVDYIVDFSKCYDPAKGIFDHHSNFEFESAVSLIRKYLQERKVDTYLDSVIEYVHWQDLTGNAVRHFAGQKIPELETVSLNNILAAMRDNGLADIQIYRQFELIFDSLYKRNRIYQQVRQGFDKVVSFYNDKIALVKDGCGLETSMIWDDFPEIDFVIYSEKENTGIIRRDGTDYDLRNLEKLIEEPGWFFHISGFIAARGTKKAPSKNRSRYCAEDLAGLVTKVFC